MDESATNPELIRIVVPGEARPYRERAHTYRRRRKGSRGQPVGSLAIGSYMPAAHKRSQDTIGHIAKQAMRGRKILECPIRLHVRSFIAIPRNMPANLFQQVREGRCHPCKTPDVTNVIKLAEDALIGIVIKDDKQVVRQADDTGRYFSFWPRLEIDVEPLTFCQRQADELAIERPEAGE